MISDHHALVRFRRLHQCNFSNDRKQAADKESQKRRWHTEKIVQRLPRVIFNYLEKQEFPALYLILQKNKG